MSRAINAVVLGASGYVGAELLRLIAAHPHLQLSAAISGSRAGSTIGSLVPPLQHCFPNHEFVTIESALDSVDNNSRLALFAAAPHGVCGTAIATVLSAAEEKALEVHAVDVSADFRYSTAADFETVYGVEHPAPELLPLFNCALPEHEAGVPSPHIGHPGCFATAVLLAAVPAMSADLVEPDFYVTGITGSTGSGRSASAGTHHPERHSNLYAYKPLEHRHAPEIEALIIKATTQQAAVNFIPHSGPFARGIYVTLQAKLRRPVSTHDARDAFRQFYANAEFVHVQDGMPRLKDVVASNHANLGVACNGSTLVITCAIDNLVKGAAGGAMQWMNRLWSLPERSGLDAPAPGGPDAT